MDRLWTNAQEWRHLGKESKSGVVFAVAGEEAGEQPKRTPMCGPVGNGSEL